MKMVRLSLIVLLALIAVRAEAITTTATPIPIQTTVPTTVPTSTATPDTCGLDIAPITLADSYDPQYLKSFTTTSPLLFPSSTPSAATPSQSYDPVVEPTPGGGCDNPKLKIICTGSSSCTYDPKDPGKCTIRVYQKLCDKFPSLPGIGSLQALIEWLKTHSASDPEIYKLITMLLHETVHCKDRCNDPKIPGCQTEMNAFESNINAVKSTMAALHCGTPGLPPQTQQWCSALDEFLRSLQLQYGVNQCVCRSGGYDNCLRTCVADCLRRCDDLHLKTGICAQCQKQSDVYCKNRGDIVW